MEKPDTVAVQDVVARLVRALREERTEAFFVGGCVRDLLLGRPLHDLDLVVAGDAVGLARRLARALGGAFVLLDEGNAIARIVLGARTGERRRTVDVAAMRGGDLCTDLAARDLTINAMALTLEALPEALGGMEVEERVIDPFGGREDLKRRLLRALGREALLDDPLRTLRVVRLAAELDFAVDASTACWTRDAAPLLAQVSWERIRDELVRLLLCTRAGRFLPLLEEYGLLQQILPEVETAGTAGMGHLREVVGSLEAIVSHLRGAPEDECRVDLRIDLPDPAGLLHRLDATLCDERTVLFVVKLAALLHHVQPARETARRVGRRLRLSDREVRALVTAVARPEAESLWEGTQVAPRAVYRFFRACGVVAEAVLLLDLVERLEHRLGTRRDNLARATEVLRLAQEQRDVVIDPPKLLDGNALVAALGLEPGPWVGRLLEEIREAQAAGEIHTREEALAWARDALRACEGLPQSGMTVPQ